MPLLAKSIKGSEGRITLPGVGALIGEMYTWQLYSEDGEVYILRAACNILQEDLWEEAGEHRRIELHIFRDNWYEAKLIEGASVDRKGKHFTIKSVTLSPI